MLDYIILLFCFLRKVFLKIIILFILSMSFLEKIIYTSLNLSDKIIYTYLKRYKSFKNTFLLDFLIIKYKYTFKTGVNSAHLANSKEKTLYISTSNISIN